VKFTFDLWQHPDVLSWGPGRAKVAVLDDTTFTVTYRPGYGEEPRQWTRYQSIPKHLLEELDPADIYGWDFWLETVGNGPYRFLRRVPQTALELEANPDFYLGRPQVDRVILKQAGESAAELLSGNVDAMFASPVLAKLLAEDPRFRVYHGYRYPFHSGDRLEPGSLSSLPGPPSSSRTDPGD